MRINFSGVAFDQDGCSPNIELDLDQEVCLDEGGHSVGSSSPDCRRDLYLGEIAKTGSLYEVKIIKGCY